MPNTKSGRASHAEQCPQGAHNRHQKSGLKTLEKRYTEALAAGRKDEAAQALRAVSFGSGQGSQGGAIHRAKAARKKGRLACAWPSSSKPSTVSPSRKPPCWTGGLRGRCLCPSP